jgi:hypothetical protein
MVARSGWRALAGPAVNVPGSVAFAAVETLAGQLLSCPGMISVDRARQVGFAGVTFVLGMLVPSCATPPAKRPPQDAQLSQAITAPERLAPPEDLPGPARTILRARMASHAQDMGALMSSVMVLRYDLIAERAIKIADDASMARPLTGDATELNSALPEKFFSYQDELRRAARALATAATQQNALPVADAYARLSGTCVRCHATYRQGQH